MLDAYRCFELSVVWGQDGGQDVGSVYIRRRETKTKGTRWHVRYERDRASPIVFLGSYPSEKAAKDRKLAAQVALSQGREPTQYEVIERSGDTMTSVSERWLETLLDIEDRTRTNYEISVQRILLVFGPREPDSITRGEVQSWVGTLKRGVVRLRLTTLAQILDHAAVVPNPARGRIRKPKPIASPPVLLTPKQLAVVYEKLEVRHPDRRYACELLEHLGLRVNELLRMPSKNVDHARGRVFVQWAKTPAGVRFVEVLDGSVVLPRWKTGRRFDFTDQALRNSLRRACVEAGVPVITPHDLRHLHASRLLHDARLSPVEIQHRLGHEKLSTTLDTYAHLVPPEDDA